MNNYHPETILFVALIVAVIVIIASYYLLRWIFDVKKQLDFQRRQITLLKMIAIKLGVPETDLPEDIKE